MKPLSFCYDQYGHPTDWQRDLAAIKSIEPRALIRHDAVWEYVDGTGSGRYDWAANPNLDARVAAVLALGLRNHLVVPMWAPVKFRGSAPDKTQVKTDAALSAYCAFVRALAARYAGKVTSWEPGNEGNLRTPFAPDGADPEWQAKVTSAAAGLVPRSWKLITPGLAPAPDSGGSMTPLTYAKRYWPALTPQTRERLHGFGIHPYGRAADVHQSWSVLGMLPALHDLTGKPLWATEQNTDGNDSDAARATLEPAALDYLDGLGYVERTFVYAMSDPETDGSVRWGLTTGTGKARPILPAVRAWAAKHHHAGAAA